MQLINKSLNKEILQQILDCFVQLTNIRAAYFDNYHELVNGNDKEICRFCSLIRQFPDFYIKCVASDEKAFKKAEEIKSLYLYRCHMGLGEAVIPIIIRNHLVGYLMLGQIKTEENREKNWNEIRKKLDCSSIPNSTVQDIKEAYDSLHALSEEKVRAAVKMLDIIARHIVNADVIHIFDMEAIEKAKQYIDTHYKEPLSTGSIAVHIGLSPSYFSFLFKNQTGETVTSYIKHVRIEHAKELLEMSSEPVKIVAYITGYQDQNYFSRIFKKETGLSPMAYRAKNKKLC